MKYCFIKLTLKQLIVSGIHVGYSKNYLNKNIRSFLFGYYNHFTLINLYYTNFQLKLIVKLIINLIFSRQNIIFLKSTGFNSFITDLCSLSINNFFIFDYT
jgi:ribosomal protein S2